MTDERSTPDAGPDASRVRRLRPTGLALTFAALLEAAGLAWLLAGDLDLAQGRWLALLLAVALSGWSLALLIDLLGDPRRAARQGSDRGILVSLLASTLLVGLARSIWLELDISPQRLGLADRILLLPVVVVGIVGLGRAMRLRGWVTILAALMVVGGVLRESERFDWPQELVAAAGPADLAAARTDGQPIALRGQRHDHNAGVAAPPRRAGMRCQRITGTDQRRTLIGAPSRRIEIRAEACWLNDGTPYTVQVVAFAAANDALADPLATQVTVLDPFDRDQITRPVEAVPATTPSAGAGGAAGGRIRAFDDEGTVRLAGSPGPVTLRVERKGRTIALAVGWLSTDPLARDHGDAGMAIAGRPDATTAITSGDPSITGDGQPLAVAFGLHPARNEVLDIFRVRFSFLGGPDASLTQARPGARRERVLQSGGNTPGYQRRGDLLVEDVRLAEF